MSTMRTQRWVGLVLVVLVGLSGCSGDDAEQAGPDAPPPSSTTTSPPSTSPAPPGGSDACRAAPESPPTEQTIRSGGEERTFLLEVPDDLAAGTPMPLLFNFHGSGSNAVEQAAYSRLPEVGTERGLIVVTPEAVAGNWLLTTPGDTGSADLRLVRDLLDQMEQRFCIDPARVYAAGMSLGAAFSALAACAYPDRIAAIGLVTVELTFEPCPRTVPVVAFHGTADPVVPYDGGPVTAEDFVGAEVPGAEENMRSWAELGGCALVPEERPVSDDVTRSEYPGCDNAGEVVLYTIDGGGHTWPGTPIEVAELGSTTDDVDATTVILDFLADHPFTP